MQAMQPVFNDIEKHLLADEKPSVFFRELTNTGLFYNTYPFTLLGDLMNTNQSPTHHPEGNVWEHTMLVVDLAAQLHGISDDPRVLMWSALLHDLGKSCTTKVRKGRITAYNHDRKGATLAAKFLRNISGDQTLIEKVSRMVRWHMQILFVVKNLPFADLDGMMAEVPLGEISLLSLCDRLGRGNMNEDLIKGEIENLQYFLNKCQAHQRNAHSEEKAPLSNGI